MSRRLVLAAAMLVVLAPAGPAVAAEPTYRVFAFGDSYGSGEGAPGLLGSYDEDGTDPSPRETWSGSTFDREFTGDTESGLRGARRCHRSPKATAAVAAKRLEAEFPDVDVVFRSFACSGARIDVGVLGQYKGIDDGTGKAPPDDVSPKVPSQLTQANDVLEALPEAERRIDALLMNIGGNNLGFASVIQKCFELPVGVDPCSPSAVSDGGGNDDAKHLFETGAGSDDPSSIGLDGLPRLYERLDAAVDRRLLAGLPPLLLGARPRDVLLSGPPAVLAGGYDGCSGLTGFYDYDNRLRADERRWLTSDIFPRFVGAIRDGAAASGWGFVDMTNAFANGICAATARRINRNRDGLRAQGAFVDTSTPLGRPIQVSAGWVHPNGSGFADMATRMHAALRPRFVARFTPPSPVAAVPVAQTALVSTVQVRAGLPATGYPMRTGWSPLGGGTRAGRLGENVVDVPVPADGSAKELDLLVRACGPLGNETTGIARGCSPGFRSLRVLAGTPGTPSIEGVDYDAAGGALVRFAPSAGAPPLRRLQAEIVRENLTTTEPSITGSICSLVGPTAQPGEPSTQVGQDTCPEELDPPSLPPIRVSLPAGAREAVVPSPGPGGTITLRECTDRGCGPGTTVRQPSSGGLVPILLEPNQLQLDFTPLGQAVAQLQPAVRNGRRATLYVGWRAWKGWRDLRSIDVELSDRRGRLGTLRLDPVDGTVRLKGRGGRDRAARTRGRRGVRSGAIGLEAPAARLVRRPSTAGFALPLRLRGATGRLEVRLGATARSGRVQAPEQAATAVVRR